MFDFIVSKYNYWISIVLMMIGLYGMIAKKNLVKKIIGMNIFQVSVFLFYISMGKIKGGTAPIYWEKAVIYDNPIPHVLILTAIVVSISTTAVALAIIILIYKKFGTIEEDKILELMEKENRR
ncbi:MAG: cation:proton antiporter subunit C [Proteobacteria bacterium]|nr:cation:proton antiporter subunit C [Pseudomonadota bacterium]